MEIQQQSRTALHMSIAGSILAILATVLILLALLFNTQGVESSLAHAAATQERARVATETNRKPQPPQSHPHTNSVPTITVRPHPAPDVHPQLKTLPAINTPPSYEEIARQAATANGLDPDRFVRQINQESGFNPQAVSPAGAIGIAQFMPGTAASLGVDPYDPVSSLQGAARMMGDLNRQFGGNASMALAAYNAGPGAVQSAISAGGDGWLSVLPAETQNYVQTIR